MSRFTRWFTGWRAEAVVLGFALLVRLWHWVGILGDPLAANLRMDPQYHDQWARAIAGGDLTFDGPFFRAPLYAYFLGGIYAAWGAVTGGVAGAPGVGAGAAAGAAGSIAGSIAAARLIQLVLGLGTAFFVMRIGKRTFGERAGLIAGGLWGVYPIALRYEGDLLVEGLFIFLTMAALLQYLRCSTGNNGRGWFGAGTLFGLAVITRPNLLAFVVLLPVLDWLARSREGSSPTVPGKAPGRGSSAAKVWAAFALGLVLPILPVTAHNLIVGRDRVPIASQGGVNFWIGNNPKSDGFTAIVPGTRATWWGGHDDARALAEQAVGRKLKASEVSDYWFDAGWSFIRTEPAAAVRLGLRKLFLCFWGAEISNNEHIYFLRHYSWPMRLTLWHLWIFFPFGILAPMALVGIGVLWRRRAPGSTVLAGYVAIYAASVVAFFVCARFRLPVVPILLLFAAGGALAVARARPTTRYALLAAVIGLVLVLNADPYRVTPAVFGSQALSYLDLGVYRARRGEFDEAERLLRKAAKLDPGHPGPHAMLGRMALERGQLEEAEVELRFATRGDPVLFRDIVTQAQRDLGRLAIERGWFDRARTVYELSLTLDPESAQAHAGAGIAAAALGDSAGAAEHFARALALDPVNAVAHAGRERLLRFGAAKPGAPAGPGAP
jgi:tetratricopeptide (TPR) repeat protein